MFMSSTVNVPLALFTVILRRFIDRFRAPQPHLEVACRAGNLLHIYPNLRPVVYVYIIISLVRCLIGNAGRGTTCKSIKIHQKAQKRKISSKNFPKNRLSKRSALSYTSSLCEDEKLAPPRRHHHHHQHHSEEYKRPKKRYDNNLSTYSLNSYFIPKLKDDKKNESIPDDETRSEISIKTILSPRQMISSELSINTNTTYMRGDSHKIKKNDNRMISNKKSRNKSEINYSINRTGKIHSRKNVIRKKKG
ncbi:uncharacterized protein [Onthophagus taurus]|uniref:uncharacterized protein n=1 Tax=Onthophagus taurus TaxID=166361 RepID=UPI0039BDEFA9